MQDIFRLYLSIDEARRYRRFRSFHYVAAVLLIFSVAFTFFATLWGGMRPSQPFWFLALFGTCAPFYLGEIGLGLDAGFFRRRLRRSGRAVWIFAKVSGIVVSWPCLLLLAYYLAKETEASVVGMMMGFGGLIAVSCFAKVRNLHRRKCELDGVSSE